MRVAVLERSIDLSSLANQGTVLLGYGYQPGMAVTYGSARRTYRNVDGSLHYDPALQEDLDERVTLEILERDDVDDAFHLLYRHEPQRLRRSGQLITPPPAHLIYSKETSFGEVLACSERAPAFSLMLPRAVVGKGTSWHEIERRVPARSRESIEIIRKFRVVSIEHDFAAIAFHCDPVIYTTDASSGPQAQITVVERGEYVFNTRWGVLARAETDETVSTREGGRRVELLTSRTTELVEG